MNKIIKEFFLENTWASWIVIIFIVFLYILNYIWKIEDIDKKLNRYKLKKEKESKFFKRIIMFFEILFVFGLLFLISNILIPFFSVKI